MMLFFRSGTRVLSPFTSLFFIIACSSLKPASIIIKQPFFFFYFILIRIAESLVPQVYGVQSALLMASSMVQFVIWLGTTSS